MSQVNSIFKELLAGRQVTPLIALNKFGCLRLAARIHDIRDVIKTLPAYVNWQVKTNIIHKGRKHYASYQLIRGEK